MGPCKGNVVRGPCSQVTDIRNPVPSQYISFPPRLEFLWLPKSLPNNRAGGKAEQFEREYICICFYNVIAKPLTLTPKP